MKKKIYLFSILSMIVFVLVGCQKDTEDNQFELLSQENPQNDVYYEIFVRSFADSDGDGIGDLNGITNNLDYLEELGVTSLWLMPINEGPSYHGYSITDYYNIESDYGTLEDFENLIDEASSRGIDILMDLVINHTSDQHPWYIEAQYDETSPYRDYYIWTGENTGYSSFVGGMVDLDLSNEAVVNEIHHMVDFYMAMGVKGFRLDAAKHFFVKEVGNGSTASNIIFIAQLNAYMKSIDEDSFLISEVYETTFDQYAAYFQASDSAFNFYGSDKIVDAISGSSISRLVSRLKNSYNAFSKYNIDFIDTPFLRNHDQDRFASIISQDYLDQKLKLGAHILLTLPGSPIIYYGEEIGLKGYRYEALRIDGYDLDIYDEYRRSPLLWGNDQETTWLPDIGINDDVDDILIQEVNEDSLLNTYKEIIEIRKDNPALMYGNSFEAYNGNTNKIQGYIRSYSYEDYEQVVLVIHNLSSQSIDMSDLVYEELLYGTQVIEAYDSLIVTINPENIGDYI
jgi:glycosidase